MSRSSAAALVVWKVPVVAAAKEGAIRRSVRTHRFDAGVGEIVRRFDQPGTDQ